MNNYLWQQDLDFQYEESDKVEKLQEQFVLEHINYALKYSPFLSKSDISKDQEIQFPCRI